MKDDEISRKAVLKLLSTMPPEEATTKALLSQSVKQMDAAQPERLTDDDFETIRIHLSAFKESLCNQRRWKEAEDYERLISRFMSFASAQPECVKEFVMLKVIDLNGRPYYSIIYLENGNEFEGYSSYDLKVISEYLKRYFGFAQPDSLVRPSARWMSVGHKSARICSRCFRDEPYKFADHDADVYDFCPHCGAKMEVSE